MYINRSKVNTEFLARNAKIVGEAVARYMFGFQVNGSNVELLTTELVCCGWLCLRFRKSNIFWRQSFCL